MVRKMWIGETVGIQIHHNSICHIISSFTQLRHVGNPTHSVVKAVTVLHKKGTVVKKPWASKSKSTKYINSMENRDGISVCFLGRS